MKLTLQETPQAPSYASPNIVVPANIATPQATMKLVNEQQTELNAVNTLTSGGRRRTKRQQKKGRSRQYKHKSFIRTYKGRRWQQQQQQQQQKGGAAAVPDGRIPITQVGSLCSSGTQCSGVQNANLIALKNQAESNGLNDQYVSQSGGKKIRRHSHKTHRKEQYSITDTIAYNIKKVMRKVFS
jgi:hypothetical protein